MSETAERTEWRVICADGGRVTHIGNQLAGLLTPAELVRLVEQVHKNCGPHRVQSRTARVESPLRFIATSKWADVNV